jgi:hypothetical protein
MVTVKEEIFHMQTKQQTAELLTAVTHKGSQTINFYGDRVEWGVNSVRYGDIANLDTYIDAFVLEHFLRNIFISGVCLGNRGPQVLRDISRLIACMRRYAAFLRVLAS